MGRQWTQPNEREPEGRQRQERCGWWRNVIEKDAIKGWDQHKPETSREQIGLKVKKRRPSGGRHTDGNTWAKWSGLKIERKKRARRINGRLAYDLFNSIHSTTTRAAAARWRNTSEKGKRRAGTTRKKTSLSESKNWKMKQSAIIWSPITSFLRLSEPFFRFVSFSFFLTYTASYIVLLSAWNWKPLGVLVSVCLCAYVR